MTSIHHSSRSIRHPLRAVLFDAVGTLIRPEPSVAAAYAQAGRRHGVDLAEEEIARRFRQALARQDQLDRAHYAGRTDQQREVNRWRDIVADVFGPSPRAELIFDDLWEHFAQPANWRLFDDAAATWDRLTSAGLTLGIASNFDERLDGICQALSPLSGCEHLFVSSRVGWRKPRPEFLAAIAERLHLAPAEMLLVGDDLENDYLAARAAGWQAVHLDRTTSAGHHRDPRQSVTGVATITTLADLADFPHPVA